MSAAHVRRRHVYFLSGFDPKGASYYHRLYSSEAQRQGQVSGASYRVGPRQRMQDGNTSWRVDAVTAGQASETTCEYVRWDDIVRARWPRTPWKVLTGGVAAYASALTAGRKLGDVWRAAPKTVVSLVYPAVFWFVSCLLGLALGVTAGALLGGGVAGWVVGILLACGFWWAALLLESRINTSWLLRIYAFAGDWSRNRVTEIEPRMETLAAAIAARLADPDIDEVLLVGFSVGSMLAVDAAARLQARTTARDLEKFSLLTLGHCIPLLGAMAGAAAFRENLRALAHEPRLDWTDVASPLDWGSFALVDPIPLSLGLPPGSLPHGPLMLSPRFHTMFEAASYAAIRGDKRRMHMQYLMAGELPSAYDYFAITAGPERLAGRWPPRKP
jgi:pimeloyl-ACP methyl ester carboxylesterase